ncbi:MAG: hypothetical protein IPN90_05230 [Elusimicrobia bacterium]|nr:hypothetical protein [Elusimicrobiota bacterium]
MESAVKIIVGIILLLVSLAYLYRPVLVLRVNAWGRMLLFNDAHLLHYRRRWGLLAFLAAVLFLYSGFLNLSQLVSVDPVRDPIEAGYLSFYEKRFDVAAEIAVQYLKDHPRDPHAEFLFRQARAASQRLKQKP